MISKSTETNYKRQLKYLDDKGIDYKNILDGEHYIQIIKNINVNKKEDKISDATVKLYIVATLWYHKENRDNIEIKKLENEMNNINKKLKEEVLENKLIRTQKENYVDWTEIVRVYEKVKQDYKRTKNQHKNYVLLSCYILLAPRRLKDYAEMYVVSDENNIDENNNYYVKNNGYFIFNNYKTKKVYKQQKIELTSEHKKILDEYITSNNIHGSLFSGTEHMIQSKLVRLFMKYLKKQISVNILRHSYISWLNDTGKLNVVTRKKIAYIMAHTIEMQDEYYKNITNNDIQNDIVTKMIDFY